MYTRQGSVLSAVWHLGVSSAVLCCCHGVVLPVASAALLPTVVYVDVVVLACAQLVQVVGAIATAATCLNGVPAGLLLGPPPACRAQHLQQKVGESMLLLLMNPTATPVLGSGRSQWAMGASIHVIAMPACHTLSFLCSRRCLRSRPGPRFLLTPRPCSN
jgi:hypothetical protein